MRIGIIDYGVGNLGSLVNMFYRLAIESSLVRTAADLRQYDRVVLPGVGAYDVAVEQLVQTGFDTAIKDFAAAGHEVLGICLGMQLLLEGSAEGNLPGLSLIPGYAKKFVSSPNLRVPHIGWNSAAPTQEHRFTEVFRNENRFYFAHSYHASSVAPEHVIATTEYGEEFPSAIARRNVTGAQFHPEKSHRFGMSLLRVWAS